MVYDFKPIETRYKGCWFRSRLEARWAVFFDYIGCKWEYEPEGFNLGNRMYYLPDFLIHDVTGRFNGDLWVEVKGYMSEKDAEKINTFARGHSGLEVVNPILVVGNIPTWDEINIDGYTQLMQERYYKGMNGRNVSEFNYETIDGDWFGCCPYARVGGGLYLDDENRNYDSEFISKFITDYAFNMARQERF